MLFIPDCINVLIMTLTDISFYFKYNCESRNSENIGIRIFI